MLYDLTTPNSNDGDVESSGHCWCEEDGKESRRHIHAELATQPPSNLNMEELKWREIPRKRATRNLEEAEPKHVYSEALSILITQCLEYYLAQRPTIETLVAEIRVNRDKFDNLDTAFEDMDDEDVSLEGASIFRLASMADPHPIEALEEGEDVES